MTFTLRPYQVEFENAVREGHRTHTSVLGELATGLGKTVSFTKYAAGWEHGRTMVVCPQIHLIGQAAKKILKETGIMPSIEQGSNYSNELEWARNPFVVASKQTLCSKSQRFRRFEDIGLLVIDEAHYACTEAYSEMINWFIDRGAQVLGVTATARRHDKRAMGQVFDQCVFQYGIADAISDAWLVPIRITSLQLKSLDLSDVRTSQTFLGKDLNQKQLNEKLENEAVIHEIAAAVNQETAGQKTAIYCSSVREAREVAEVLVDVYKIRADWICADKRLCSDEKRTEVLKSFCEDPNGVTHVANVGILTTGWDYPDLMCIVNARPTKSLPLYTQILGRLTRPCEVSGLPVVDVECETAEDRRDAISRSRKPYGRMIDLVDTSLKHKLVTATDVLGGKWSLAVREQIKAQIANKSGPTDINEEAEAARLELEEARRRELAAKRAAAEFRKQNVDPFGGPRAANVSSRSATMVMATQKQMGFLAWKMGRSVRQYQISKRQASRMIRQLKTGLTPAQVLAKNRLRRIGESVEPQTSGDPDFDEIFSALR